VTFIIIYPTAEIRIDQAIPYQAYHVNMVCPKRGETSVILIDAAKVPTAGFKRLGRRFLHCRGTEQGKIGDLNSLNFDKPVIQHTDIIRYLWIDEWNTPFGILSIY
jgi:hypothetical protein